MNYIEKAISLIGTQARLAEICKVKQASVSKWKAKGAAPAEHAIAIEKATDGEVTCEQLCPSAEWFVVRKKHKDIA